MARDCSQPPLSLGGLTFRIGAHLVILSAAKDLSSLARPASGRRKRPCLPRWADRGLFASSSQVGEPIRSQVPPVTVAGLDQLDLLDPQPTLDLLLPRDRVFDVAEGLVVDQSRNV